MVNEKTLAQSFRKIKADIMTLQSEILEIKEIQAHVAVEVENLSTKLTPTRKKVSKKKR